MTHLISNLRIQNYGTKYSCILVYYGRTGFLNTLQIETILLFHYCNDITKMNRHPRVKLVNDFALVSRTEKNQRKNVYKVALGTDTTTMQFCIVTEKS